MPFDFPLPRRLQRARWKVKIRDKENREHPHVTIIWKTRSWRINLRTGKYMDGTPDPSDVPTELVALLKKKDNWQALCDAWDRLHPQNPVSS